MCCVHQENLWRGEQLGGCPPLPSSPQHPPLPSLPNDLPRQLTRLVFWHDPSAPRDLNGGELQKLSQLLLQKCASAGRGKTSTKCCFLRPPPDLASLWLQNSARALEMKCYLQRYQLLQPTAAIHMASPESPGTRCATAATQPKWQGGKETQLERIQGMRSPVPRKKLQHRFSPLNNHQRHTGDNVFSC